MINKIDKLKSLVRNSFKDSNKYISIAETYPEDVYFCYTCPKKVDLNSYEFFIVIPICVSHDIMIVFCEECSTKLYKF